MFNTQMCKCFGSECKFIQKCLANFVNLLHVLVGEEDLFDVLAEVISIASSWKAIGRGLQIDSECLDLIQKSNPGNPKECLSEMLTCWLKKSYNVERFGERTWRAVVKVVAHPAAGDNFALALNIAKQHSGNS